MAADAAGAPGSCRGEMPPLFSALLSFLRATCAACVCRGGGCDAGVPCGRCRELRVRMTQDAPQRAHSRSQLIEASPRPWPARPLHARTHARTHTGSLSLSLFSLCLSLSLSHLGSHNDALAGAVALHAEDREQDGVHGHGKAHCHLELQASDAGEGTGTGRAAHTRARTHTHTCKPRRSSSTLNHQRPLNTWAP